MTERVFRRAGAFVGLLLFALALWVLHGALREHRYDEILREIGQLPPARLVLALVLAALSYVLLSWYEVLAFRYIGHPLSFSRIAAASFIGNAFTHNIGNSLFTGVPARFRLYSVWGLSALEIAKIVAFCSATLWLGYCALAGTAILAQPPAVPASLHLPLASVRLLGLALLLPPLAYLAWSVAGTNPLRIKEWEFPHPSPEMAAAQVLVSAADWALAGLALYALLPPAPGLSATAFLGVFLLAQITGLASQVPGGLGVFESVALVLLSPAVPAPQVVGSLLAFRGIYYLLPLVLGAVALGAHELLQQKEGVKRVARIFGQWVPGLVPHVLAFTTFLGGSILLLSGATPADRSRLAWLNDFLPLPFVEVSHFLGSLAGAGLLLLARGLQRRLDAAYHLTVALLGTGIVVSLLKGLDYEEAITLAIMLGALAPCRRHFYRRASMIAQPLTASWVLAILLVLAASIWLGVFSHKHLEYSGELWWEFAIHSDAPRFLRATVGSTGLVLLFALARLLRAAPPEPSLPGPEELESARAIVEKSRRTLAHLALLGDKELLFSDSGSAFLMYGIESRSWVALGEPVGPEEERSELAWRFREASDRHDGWTVFYQMPPESLNLCLDLGLALLKLGEEARVPLEEFSLEGGRRKHQRHVLNKLDKDGCVFEVIPAVEVAPRLGELRVISDAWLAQKSTREKGFSLGFFAPEYLRRFPAALVERRGKPVAFANVLPGAEKEEVSIDLMRHLPDAPEDVMEYLFLKLILWGKQQGYRWFNLGMAPLSGLEDRALAPLWNRVAGIVFRHGEHFYNFQGLRQYKEKFDPRWEPRYLASPGGLALPRILTHVAALVSRGYRGVVAR